MFSILWRYPLVECYYLLRYCVKQYGQALQACIKWGCSRVLSGTSEWGILLKLYQTYTYLKHGMEWGQMKTQILVRLGYFMRRYILCQLICGSIANCMLQLTTMWGQLSKTFPSVCLIWDIGYDFQTLLLQKKVILSRLSAGTPL